MTDGAMADAGEDEEALLTRYHEEHTALGGVDASTVVDTGRTRPTG